MARNDPVRDKLGYWGYVNARDRLISEQDGTCYYCLRPMFRHWRDAPDVASYRAQAATIDHIEPLSRGGSWKRHNLCAACKECNTRKGCMSEEDFHALLMAEGETDPSSQESAA